MVFTEPLAERVEHYAEGIHTVNRVPQPGSLWHAISPPCACTIRRAVASPSPKPSGLVEVAKTISVYGFVG